jgi:flagellar protein FliO/FliZ
MILVPVKKLKVKSKIYFSGILFLFSTKVYAIEDVVTQVIKSDSVMKSSFMTTGSMTTTPVPTDPMSGSYLTQLVLGLLVVILCIVALAWFAKKMNRFHSVTNDSLKIISGISMGSRERIVLLQVGKEQLLVGVSPGRINKLHVLNSSITTSTGVSSNTEDKHFDKGFADKLKTMMADAVSDNKTNNNTNTENKKN